VESVVHHATAHAACHAGAAFRAFRAFRAKRQGL